MDIINPKPHTVLYPGIDRFKCGVCQQWICTSGEIERLENIVKKEQQKTAKQSQKKIAELNILISQEKKIQSECKPKS